MMSGVYHIHSQADAQAELDRQRLMQRVRDARKKQRTQENPVRKAQLQSIWVKNKRDSRARKREAIDDDSSDNEAKIYADRITRMREAQKAKILECSMEERADILNKIEHRYYFLRSF